MELDIIVGEYTVQMDDAGKLTALRHSEPWRDCIGDNLILALAQEVESLRECNTALQSVVNEAAKCFYGPEEQKPGTWGWEVTKKLHALAQ